MGFMSEFKRGDKITISNECKDELYRGIPGTVLDVNPIPSSDGLINRVGLDDPVDYACVFWFADHELVRRE